MAHNASFDCSVLRQSLTQYGLLFPTLSYLCSVKVAKRTWPELPSHRLDSVAAHIGFKFKHHNALEDALACGHIIARAMEFHEAWSIEDLAVKAGVGIGEMWCDGYAAPKSKRRSRRKASVLL